MKKSEVQKAHLPVNGIFQISFISILIFFIFSGPGYGGTDIPVKVNTTPVVIGAAGFDSEPGLTKQGIFSVVKADIGTTAASTFVAGFRDDEAVYAETPVDSETEDGTIHTARPQCQDSCSL